MNETRQRFNRLLVRQQRWWQAGALACGALRLLRLAVLLLGGYVVLDYILAFSVAGLLGMNGVFLVALVFLLAWEAINVLGISRGETALRSDQLTANRRQPVRAALELQAQPADDALGGFLVDKAMAEAVAQLEGLKLAQLLPIAELRRQALRFVLAVALVVALLAIDAPAAQTVLARLRHPQADIPPYSPYQFNLTSGAPRVLYGASLELRVQVSGGPVRQGVELWTRHDSDVHRVACFREGESVFSQRLDRVVDPVEFCFAMGRACSAWQRVDLLMQPKVSLVKLQIEPPAYTRLATRETILGEDVFDGYKGSKARLQLTSNRPLARGTLTLAPLDGLGGARIIQGEPTGPHTLAFEWEMRQPAKVEVRIEDTQGTAIAEPLRLTQKLTADHPPEVTVHTPPPYSLATPSSVIPLKGSATDDLALRSVDLARTVVGFRDRTVSLGPELPDKQYAFARDLNLRQLGVVPGQVLELYVEARDFNPDRTGIGSSGIVRIEIIPEAEYAEMIRANETLDQFLARFEAVQANLNAFNETVEQLHRELTNAAPDAKKIQQALDLAARQNQDLQSLVEKLKNEFHAYDLEAKFAGSVQEMADKLRGQANLLWGMKPSSPQLPDAVNRLRKDLLEEQEQMRQEMAQAQEAAKVGRVMEQAAAFMQMLNRQRQVVRQLQRFDPPSNVDPGEVGYYGRQESGVLDDLKQLQKNMEAAAQGLPEGEKYDKLRSDTLAFAKKLQETQADQLMQQAVTAGENQDGPKAHRTARLALERLEALLKERNEGNCQFAGLCQGGMKFSPGEQLQQTLSQMLQSMKGRGNKPGRGGEAGGGAGGGDGGDGYWMPSQTRLNTPVFGPARMQFKSGTVQGGGGQGGMPGRVVGAGSRESIGNAPDKPVQSGARSPELMPARYRDAVKRYFNQPE